MLNGISTVITVAVYILMSFLSSSHNPHSCHILRHLYVSLLRSSSGVSLDTNYTIIISCCFSFFNFSIMSSVCSGIFVAPAVSFPKQFGGSGRLSMSRTAAYFSIKLASKSAKPLHSSLLQSAIMVYLLFLTATLCVRLDDLRRDTVKNPFYPFIIALQPCFL